MCCFSGTVKHVEKTKIFARALDASRQALVYSMTIAADAPVAMVLPIPIAPGSELELINLEGYPSFFDDLERGFPVPAARSFSAPRVHLAVVHVGSFVASFVPGPNDFDRLDPRFRMPPGVFDRLPQYRDYGFAVFQLGEPNAKIHPMAFSFARREPSQLFFPTVHVHDRKVHKTAEFDHALFLQRAEPVFPPELQIPGGDEIERRGWFPSWSPASRFMDLSRALGLVDGDAPVRVRRMKGKLPNADVVFTG